MKLQDCFSIPRPLLLLLLTTFPFQLISQYLDEERSILLYVKQKLANPPSLQSWHSSSSPCDWPEISCSSNNNTVIAISLSHRRIAEKLPARICDLKNLFALDVSYNYILGEFPDILNCSELQYLLLLQNAFVGPIPADIDRLSRLQYLDLTANNFSGDIPASIRRLRELSFLFLVQNEFNGSWPSEIGNLANLEQLGIAYNDKFLPAPIPKEFGALKKLKYLWITQTNLTGEIPESLKNLSTLEHLDLALNNLTGAIPAGLLMLKNLTYLYLFNNRLSGHIPSTNIGGALNLKDIDLSNNRFSGEIPSVIWTAPGILWVMLDRNQFSGQLPHHILSCKLLTVLNFSRNHLSGSIPKAIGSLPSLILLDLSENQFSGEIPREFSHFVPNTFNLSSKNLSGQIPPAFEKWEFQLNFLNNPNLCANIPILKNCHSKASKSSSKLMSTSDLVMTISFTIAASLVIVFLIFFMVQKKHYQWRDQLQGNINSIIVETWKMTSFQKLDFTESNILSSLAQSENSTLIGSGGLGKVYRAVINHSGEVVVVKWISNSTRKVGHNLEKQFEAEVQILGMIRHSNIVKLLCCIWSESSKLLVYEYMENQSLDKWLMLRRGHCPYQWIREAILSCTGQ